MKKNLFFLILVIIFLGSTLQAKKKNKKEEEPKKEVVVDVEEKNFEEKLTYQKKYEKRYGLGIYAFATQLDGIPEATKTEKTFFYGPGFSGRVDLSKNITLFPNLFYTLKKSKVYTDHTKEIKYLGFGVDGTYRKAVKDDLFEFFPGLGLYGLYKFYDVNYSTSSVNYRLSSSEKKLKTSVLASGLIIYNAYKHTSFFFSLKAALYNPSFGLTSQIGFIYQ